MDTGSIITLIGTIVTVFIAVISGVTYFNKKVTELKEQIARLEEKIMDKAAVHNRITVLEERDRQKQKFFDFLDDQIMTQFLNKK